MGNEDAYKLRIRAMGWARLRAFHERLVEGRLEGWDPGKAFEYLVLLHRGGKGHRCHNGHRAHRQDAKPVAPQAFEHRGVDLQPRGFSSPVRTLVKFVAPQTILLWKGEEVASALKHRTFRKGLNTKYRRSVEQGLGLHDVLESNT